MREIYVRLLDEGTDVYRPVSAVRVGKGMFKIGPNLDVDFNDEEWEFPPGATVLVEDAEIEGQHRPLAVKRVV
jgi:hypothetical protein